MFTGFNTPPEAGVRIIELTAENDVPVPVDISKFEEPEVTVTLFVERDAPLTVNDCSGDGPPFDTPVGVPDEYL
jgi:hypothetical protein